MEFDVENEAIAGIDIADVCIVGAGIAGLVLAQVLRKKGMRVDVVEAGGKKISETSQRFFEVECDGRTHSGVTEGRFRVFGGTSTRWGGQLLPFGEEVFRPRGENNISDWPIKPDSIYRYADQVLQMMGVNEFSFGGDFPSQIGRSDHLLDIEDVRVRYSKWMRFSRRNLAQTLGRSLAAAKNVRLFLHAGIVELEAGSDGKRIVSALCRTSNGREYRFKAKHFVLTAGTVETVRLLLCSRQGERWGIGNEHCQLGKYFHDHLSVVAGSITDGSIRQWEDFFAPWWMDGVLHTPRLEAHPRVVAERNWLDVMACFNFVTEGTGFEQFRRVMQDRQSGMISLRDVIKLASDIPANIDLVRLVLAAKLERRRLLPRGGRVEIRFDVEQVPCSCIRLSTACDELGMRKVVIDWRISPEELRTIHEFRDMLRKRWRPAWGQAIWYDFDSPEKFLPRTRDTFHMMGGARMGLNERESVVDPDLKVHGMENLFVASCAVYPRGGSSNPTFTLMCLCLRLADHIGEIVVSESCEQPSGALKR